MCESEKRIWEEWPYPPQWIEMTKHNAPPNSITWEKAIKGTVGRFRARYKRGITKQAYEEDCLRNGRNSPERFECTKKGASDTAMFWSHIGMVIGASDGEETEYIVVKYQKHGNSTQLHGYPITKRELRDEYGVHL